MNRPDHDRELARAQWRTSSHSGSGNQCVEVASLNGRRRAVRDSKDPSGPILMFSPAEWARILDTLRGSVG